MKFKNILFPFTVVLSLCCCKKGDEAPAYTVENMVVDNAQAAAYFHILFREAENAWQFIHDKDYALETYPFRDETSSRKKTITFASGENEKVVTVTYNAWQEGNDLLGGTITVTLPDINRYRVDGATAVVTLTNNFSINMQRVTGIAGVTYRKPPEGETADRYTFDLTEGAIYDKDESRRRILITGNIKSGAYERIEGGETVDAGDDVWTYSGTTTGMLHEDPNMNYTNKIIADQEYEVNYVTRKGPVKFVLGCITAREGLSQITIPGKSPVTYAYDCSAAFYQRVTGVQ